MSRITKLIVLGAVIAGGSALLRRRKGVSSTLGRTPGEPFDHIEPAVASGISNVDPEPLTQIAGEGIDLDATEQAHTELQDLHDRMPQPGVNIP